MSSDSTTTSEPRHAIQNRAPASEMLP